MKTSRIRVALVGCGGIAAHYRRVYATSPLCKMVAFVDRDIEAAQDAARECGVDDHAATTEFARVLDDDVDAVVINTPNHLHLEQGLPVIRARKHLLMQKPLASRLEEAQQLVAAAAGSDRVNGIYHSFLDHPLYHELRRRLAAGDFGPFVRAHGRYMHRGGLAWSRAAQLGHVTWRSSLRKTGGGCFIQLGVHYTHLIGWITGEEPTHVRGYAQNLRSPGIEGEDVATAILRFPGGAMATIDTTWITEGNELSIHGTQASATYLEQRWLFDDTYENGVLLPPPAMDDATNPYNGHRAFLEAIAGFRRIPVPIERGLIDMSIVDAFYRSANSGEEIALESPPVHEAERVLSGDR